MMRPKKNHAVEIHAKTRRSVDVSSGVSTRTSRGARSQKAKAPRTRWSQAGPSSPALLHHDLHGLLAGGVCVEARLLLLAPLAQLILHVRTRLIELGVPAVEGRLGLRNGLEDAQQVLEAEGVDGLRLVQLVCDTPGVPEGDLVHGRNLLEVRQKLLIQRGHLLARLLLEHPPDLLHNIGLGLVQILRLRLEEVLHVRDVLLNRLAGLIVSQNQVGGDLLDRLFVVVIRNAKLLLPGNEIGADLVDILKQASGKHQAEPLADRRNRHRHPRILDRLHQHVVRVRVIVLEIVHVLHRGAARPELPPVRGVRGPQRGEMVAALRVAVDLDDPALQPEVHLGLGALEQQAVRVWGLRPRLLLVVVGLRLEELAENLREGLHLLVRQVLLELVGLAELLVELARRLLLEHRALLGRQRPPPRLEVLLEAPHGRPPRARRRRPLRNERARDGSHSGRRDQRGGHQPAAASGSGRHP
mmetsp:Transcript_54547/g.152230  ORF Transcript_54547/g.152230 Transcript_54547/m.152230 type:complete len:471 (-) Transcript_54547:79-1491(-)